MVNGVNFDGRGFDSEQVCGKVRGQMVSGVISHHGAVGPEKRV